MCNVVAFMSLSWFHIPSNCFIVVCQVDILKSIFKYAHIDMIMIENFSDYVHWQVSKSLIDQV